MSSELELDVCYRVYGWLHLVKAMEVTAGLAKSNGSLLRWPSILVFVPGSVTMAAFLLHQTTLQ